MSEVKPHLWTNGGDKVLILRRSNKDGTSKNGFVWPKSGYVEAPDWEPTNECGHGLHGWPWGMGLGEGCDYSLNDDRWLVVEVKPQDIVGELEKGLKCKFKGGTVIYCGTFSAAWNLVSAGRHELIRALASTAGEGAHASTAGNYAHASTAGNYAHASTAGNYAHASTAGKDAHASTAGNYAHASTAGKDAHAGTAGYHAHASTAGEGANASTAGEGTVAACLGPNGRAKAGKNGEIILHYWDDKANRTRAVVGYVGEDGIKADTWYEVQGGKLVEVAQ